MKGRKTRKNSSFWGYLIFFLTVAFTVTLALVVFILVNRKSQGNLVALSVTMILVILFISGLFTLADMVRRKIMVDKPVRKILAATERLTAGDFSVRLETKYSNGKYDEYDLIMENLNRLAEELSKSELLKTDFIANVSHELKTPLAVIQSYASLLADPDLDGEARKKYAQTIRQATARLTALVTNILKLNKLENQGLLPEKELVRLDEMLASAVLAYEELIDEKELLIECDMEEVTILSAPSYLEIVWHNLISNAIKFTQKGGKISVSVKRSGKSAVVSVSDTGCGISAETGARIFDKFYQGDPSHSAEGNGLGLALVKKVIDVLGGEISVKSELGVGSTFTITVKEL